MTHEKKIRIHTLGDVSLLAKSATFLGSILLVFSVGIIALLASVSENNNWMLWVIVAMLLTLGGFFSGCLIWSGLTAKKALNHTRSLNFSLNDDSTLILAKDLDSQILLLPSPRWLLLLKRISGSCRYVQWVQTEGGPQVIAARLE